MTLYQNKVWPPTVDNKHWTRTTTLRELLPSTNVPFGPAIIFLSGTKLASK